MRYYHYLFIVLVALASCKSNDEVTDATFDIQARIVQSQRVLVDIIPQTNDYDYAWFVVPQSQAAQQSDAALIQAHHNYLYELYQLFDSIYNLLPPSERVEQFPSFETLMLERGACLYWEINLEPETPYIIGCYRYSGGTPIMTLIKHPFTTKVYQPVTTTFTFSLEKDQAIVKPDEPQQKYFCDFQRKDYIDMQYLGMPSYYFYSIVSYCEEYEFFPAALDQDTTTYSITSLLDYAPGDTIYAMSAGYSNEISDSLSTQMFRFNEDSTWTQVDVITTPRTRKHWCASLLRQ